MPRQIPCLCVKHLSVNTILILNLKKNVHVYYNLTFRNNREQKFEAKVTQTALIYFWRAIFHVKPTHIIIINFAILTYKQTVLTQRKSLT